MYKKSRMARMRHTGFMLQIVWVKGNILSKQHVHDISKYILSFDVMVSAQFHF